jgi:serine O-acetyltransferase
MEPSMTQEARTDLITGTAEALARCLTCPLGTSIHKGVDLAGQRAVRLVVDELVSVLFPGYHGHETISRDELSGHLESQLEITSEKLQGQMARAYKYKCTLEDCEDCDKCEETADEDVKFLIESMPEIQRVLESDVIAAYEGDPAAQSTMEVVMSYPGVFAIIVHRVANVLYQRGVPLIPRIMAEYAHCLTGIDIHPGAQIAEGFFIDHGTGVVIGETSVIGKRVKLYQGVTLGARSFEKDDEGNPVKGIKRHPNVGDNVVIYAGATILGGTTTIGADSEIGGNVWLTHSVPPGSKVYNQQPRPLIKQDGQWQVVNGPAADLGAGI